MKKIILSKHSDHNHSDAFALRHLSFPHGKCQNKNIYWEKKEKSSVGATLD